jgi:asparagine synthase (glutamine-hydrolysing)
MCGIAGIFSLRSETNFAEDVRRMCDAITHRGPDDCGYFVGKNIALGHRRLSIIDLSASGRQPLFNEAKDLVLIFNGEIYNYKELRADLRKKGHIFSSNTDAEVVLHAYEEWGIGSVGKFNGMFAYALWDSKRQALFLVRDRYGIKPLYYWNRNGRLLFASEIKAFLKHRAFEAKLDLKTLLEYFTFQNTFTYRTLFEGVSLLPPASYMKLALGNCISAETVQYWDFHFEEDSNPKCEDDYLEEFERLFGLAVKRQLVSDVEIGAFLSGGVDSSAIVSQASGHIKNLKTFCIGFDLSRASGLELSFDERRKAELVSSLFNTEHYERVLGPGDMQRCLPRLVWHLEDLRLGQSYPNFYASRLGGRFVKVCLSGSGGDELFAGYPWRYYRSLTAASFDDYIGGYYKYWQRLVPNSQLKKLFSPVWSSVKDVWTADIFKSVFSGHRLIPDSAQDFINHSLYFEAKTFLPGLFIVEDKLSMASGLEVRVPFLDNDLVDFACRLPVKFKLKYMNKVVKMDEDGLAKSERYFQKMRDGKIIIRKALGKKLNPRLVNQYKQGFSGPDGSWFKGESIKYVEEMLLDKKAGLYEFFDYKASRRLIHEHLSGRQNRRLFIWSLLCFELWLKIFLAKNEELIG